jgi:hypothetical protein
MSYIYIFSKDTLFSEKFIYSGQEVYFLMFPHGKIMYPSDTKAFYVRTCYDDKDFEIDKDTADNFVEKARKFYSKLYNKKDFQFDITSEVIVRNEIIHYLVNRLKDYKKAVNLRWVKDNYTRAKIDFPQTALFISFEDKSIEITYSTNENETSRKVEYDEISIIDRYNTDYISDITHRLDLVILEIFH